MAVESAHQSASGLDEHTSTTKDSTEWCRQPHLPCHRYLAKAGGGGSGNSLDLELKTADTAELDLRRPVLIAGRLVVAGRRLGSFRQTTTDLEAARLQLPGIELVVEPASAHHSIAGRWNVKEDSANELGYRQVQELPFFSAPTDPKGNRLAVEPTRPLILDRTAPDVASQVRGYPMSMLVTLPDIDDPFLRPSPIDLLSATFPSTSLHLAANFPNGYAYL